MAATDIGQLNTKQMTVAQSTFDIAVGLVVGLPGEDAVDAVLGVMTTVNDESTFSDATNDGTYAGSQAASVWGWYGGQAAYRDHMRLSFNYATPTGDGRLETTKDSMGRFQQREMYGYAGYGHTPNPGGPARLMDPNWTVRVFLFGVPNQPGVVRSWFAAPDELHAHDDLAIAKRCQWVQGSEDPDGLNYLEAVHVAHQLIDHFGGVPHPSITHRPSIHRWPSE